MPNKSIQIEGGKNFPLSPQQIQRIHAFLQWLPLERIPSPLIVVSPDDFKSMGNEFHTRVALTNYDTGRSYINGDLLNKPNVDGHTLEWVLAHEATHLNSKTAPVLQEQQDANIDYHADQLMKQYNNPQGR